MNRTDRNIFTNRRADGRLIPNGLYDPRFEHDNCGVGFVARLDGISTHTIIENSITVLINLEHRGALGGDKSTGDGAGIMCQAPDDFLRAEAQSIKLPPSGEYAIGMIFFSKEKSLQDECKKILTRIIDEEGCDVLGWRKVPVNSSTLGDLARRTEPDVFQLFVHRGKISSDAFERKLYVIRRLAEKEIAELPQDTSQFYVCSLSSNRIVYKGLLTAHQLPIYYPDLSHEKFTSKFGEVHQRYSTNTLPTWNLVQPFRYIAHNGEINTLSGNIGRMMSREFKLRSDLFGDDIEKIKPIIVEDGSDSAIFDNVLELLALGGRSLPHAMMMMVPEAYGPKIQMSEDKRAFYDFHSAIMEPWDGPAAIVFCDSRYLGSILDRNGLRPSRYTTTSDGIVILASETGVLDLDPEKIIKKSRLSPGKMLLADFLENRIVPDKEIKAKISRQKPYRRWIKENIITLRGLFNPSNAPVEKDETLLQKQQAFGYTDEELKLIITPMASRGQEAIGSMGNDTQLAILSDIPHLLFYYFKQRFAQVTNPAIDPLREELVMSLESFVGGEGSLLEESPENFKGFKFSHPILTPDDLIRIEAANHPNVKLHYVDILFDKNGGENALESTLDSIFNEATEAIEKGISLIVLSDRKINADKVPIPSLLAVAGLHHHLMRNGLRNKASMIIHSGEVREVMNFAMLISYGADAICPYLCLKTVRSMAEKELLETKLKPEEAIDSYIIAIKKGLLKTMSRLGISTLHSYFAAQTFEAVGLCKEVIDKYFWNQDTIVKLQLATRTDDYEIFKEYVKLVNEGESSPRTIRSLLSFKKRNPVQIKEVESVESIIKRFVVSAMSFGSISKEAHETIGTAMNKLGAKSNSGEGGEDPERSKPNEYGEISASKIKQVASGRFGVTPEYLLSAEELQIKIAQGAKPGEGGQLPGHKVSDEIAKVRHTTPGVTLISPPPHHDIYSIEDLAQLVFDLKCVNPSAKVSVKLVSESGVGTIAAGVAKAKADLVLISGYEGGTGASPLTSIKHTGIPWEIGLAETHQTLIFNNLRDKIRVQVDGQLKTGRDIAVAALLGAEEFGFATSILITMGCIMLRKCHQNTCSVGVATQDPVLRAKFDGKPEYVERYFRFLAQDLREQMAELGFKTVEEMVGHTEVLEYNPPVHMWKAQKFDLNPLLNSMVHETGKSCCASGTNQIDTFDTELIKLVKPALEKKKPIELNLTLRNTHRSVGARLSGEIVKRYGAPGLPDDTIEINFKGSAGQSFGAFYINCKAGERFAILNSGDKIVVEGIGDHGCEYMAGGIIVFLGSTGKNFAAGMSGGIAYIRDQTQLFDTKCNLDMVDLESVWHENDKLFLRSMIERHYSFTKSPLALEILAKWESNLPMFVKVMPIDYRKSLERMKLSEYPDFETVAVTEEVFNG